MISVALVVMPGFQLMALGALTAFELANLAAPTPLYDLHIVSETGGPIASSLGADLFTQPFGQTRFDTVIVAGGVGPPETTPGLIAYVAACALNARRLASICTGAFVLAEAGVLQGRRATTHWMNARALAAHAGVTVEEDRFFLVDGPIWTSGGLSAGVDLALGMIERDLDVDAAQRVAAQLVVTHRSGGGQSQYAARLDLDAKSERIGRVLAFARGNLDVDLSVERLAKIAGLSPRQFTRNFTVETGVAPAKGVELLRVDASRRLIEQGDLSLEAVAVAAGFTGREHMRRAFLRAFGQPPHVIRRNVRRPVAA